MNVDLIDLKSTSTVMQYEILNSAECIYASDNAKNDEFEIQVMSEYLKLNEERADILKDIESRGNIYGG